MFHQHMKDEFESPSQNMQALALHYKDNDRENFYQIVNAAEKKTVNDAVKNKLSDDPKQNLLHVIFEYEIKDDHIIQQRKIFLEKLDQDTIDYCLVQTNYENQTPLSYAFRKADDAALILILEKANRYAITEAAKMSVGVCQGNIIKHLLFNKLRSEKIVALTVSKLASETLTELLCIKEEKECSILERIPNRIMSEAFVNTLTCLIEHAHTNAARQLLECFKKEAVGSMLDTLREAKTTADRLCVIECIKNKIKQFFIEGIKKYPQLMGLLLTKLPDYIQDDVVSCFKNVEDDFQFVDVEPEEIPTSPQDNIDMMAIFSSCIGTARPLVWARPDVLQILNKNHSNYSFYNTGQNLVSMVGHANKLDEIDAGHYAYMFQFIPSAPLSIVMKYLFVHDSIYKRAERKYNNTALMEGSAVIFDSSFSKLEIKPEHFSEENEIKNDEPAEKMQPRTVATVTHTDPIRRILSFFSFTPSHPVNTQDKSQKKNAVHRVI